MCPKVNSLYMPNPTPPFCILTISWWSKAETWELSWAPLSPLPSSHNWKKTRFIIFLPYLLFPTACASNQIIPVSHLELCHTKGLPAQSLSHCPSPVPPTLCCPNPNVIMLYPSALSPLPLRWDLFRVLQHVSLSFLYRLSLSIPHPHPPSFPVAPVTVKYLHFPEHHKHEKACVCSGCSSAWNMLPSSVCLQNVIHLSRCNSNIIFSMMIFLTPTLLFFFFFKREGLNFFFF